MTAVEWLCEQIFSRPVNQTNWAIEINQALEMEKQQMTKNSSQLEISDEEIEKSMRRYNITDFGQMAAYVTGAKWYREQLKQK